MVATFHRLVVLVHIDKLASLFIQFCRPITYTEQKNMSNVMLSLIFRLVITAVNWNHCKLTCLACSQVLHPSEDHFCLSELLSSIMIVLWNNKLRALVSWSSTISIIFRMDGVQTRLGVLETWVLVSRRLETRFYKSWSWCWTSESWCWSWSWNLRVLVLEPSSLGLGIGLGTWDSGDSVFVTHEAWNWDKIGIIG